MIELVRSAASSLGLFFVVFVPLFAFLGLLEGSLAGRWGFSVAEWTYQLGAFATFVAPLLLVSGLIAGPLLPLVACLWMRRSHAARIAWSAICGAALILLAASFVTASRIGPVLLVSCPASFAVSSTAWAALVVRTIDSRRLAAVAG